MRILGSKQNKISRNKESRIEMIIQNQVLKDMDTVIQLRDKGFSPEEGMMKTNIFSNELILS